MTDSTRSLFFLWVVKKIKWLKKGFTLGVQWIHKPPVYWVIFFNMCAIAVGFCVLQVFSLEASFEGAIFYQQKLWKYCQNGFFPSEFSHPLILPVTHALLFMGGVFAWLVMAGRVSIAKVKNKDKLIVFTLVALLSSGGSWKILKGFFHGSDFLFFVISWAVAFGFFGKKGKVVSLLLGGLSLFFYSFLSVKLDIAKIELLAAPLIFPLLSFLLSWIWTKYPQSYRLSFAPLFVFFVNIHEQPFKNIQSILDTWEQKKELRNYLLSIPPQLIVVADKSAGVWIANRDIVSEWPNTSNLPEGCPQMIIVKYATGGTLTELAVRDMILRCRSSSRELELNTDLKATPVPVWKHGIWSSYLVKPVPIRVRPVKMRSTRARKAH